MVLIPVKTGLKGLGALRPSAAASGGQLSERKGKLYIRGKGGSVREVPLNAEARKALSEWLAVRPPYPSEAVFIGRWGPLGPLGPVRRRSRQPAWRGSIRMYSGTPSPPCGGRHLAVLAEPAAAGAGADLVGHGDVSTTARYTKPSAADLEAALERLGP